MSRTKPDLAAAARACRHCAALLGLGAAAFLCAQPAIAQDWPATRNGRWDITRQLVAAAMPAEKSNYKECGNPSQDWQKAYQDFAKRCQTTPLARSGNTLRFTTSCPSPTGKAEMRYRFDVESDSAYRLEIEIDQAGMTMKSVVDARFGGKC